MKRSLEAFYIFIILLHSSVFSLFRTIPFIPISERLYKMSATSQQLESWAETFYAGHESLGIGAQFMA
jgi:hypothetical protein